MKMLISALVLMSSTAFASGPENITGISNRLESMICKGAVVLTRSESQSKMPKEIERKCGDIMDEALVGACEMEVIRSIGKSLPNAEFVVKANEGVETFQMNIFDGGKTLFNSTRIGFHGDGMDSINLMFTRKNDEQNMDFMVETGMLSEDGNFTQVAYVPVKRRLLPDLFYVFTEGCNLNWAE